jgi:adenylate cyclase
MNVLMRQRLRTMLIVVPSAALAGAVYGALSTPSPGPGAVNGAVIGALISATLMPLHFSGLTQRLHRAGFPVPLWKRMLGGMLSTFVIVIACLWVGQLIGGALVGEVEPPRLLLRDVLFSIAISGVFVAAVTLGLVLGPEVMVGLITGRYAQPRSEPRLFLFADMKNSTRCAEILGDTGFHAMLNQVFADVGVPIATHGGSIYRYVGDEVIVTWRLENGAAGQAALFCVQAMAATLARRAESYRRAFGMAPEMRFALHAGPVVVGEMGMLKREVVFLGDTVNTTARLEAACKETGHDVLVSEAAMAQLAVPDGWRAESAGALQLRGKQAPISVFALGPPSRSAAPAAKTSGDPPMEQAAEA